MTTAPLNTDWVKTAHNIAAMERLEREIELRQECLSAHLRLFLTSIELSTLLSVSRAHGSDLRSGRRRVSHADRKLVVDYLRQKHADQFSTLSS